MTDLLPHEAIVWAFRMLIGRDPKDEGEIELHRQHPDVDSLRTAFLSTPEFRLTFSKFGPKQPYCAPLFLLQKPQDPALPWRFTPPSLQEPVSQLCTAGQMEEPCFAELCAALDLPVSQHRKIWEFCFLVAAMKANGLLRPGSRALGFGVGTEPLPAFLVKHGMSVLATDAPLDVVEGQGWETSNQHATGIEALDRPAIIPFETLQRQTQFRALDMNAIPDDLEGFDLCWSSCALEHLGSIGHGLRFIEESLRPLKPGGFAIHTTEFNLSSNTDTLEAPNLAFFRKRDIEELASRLVAAGHQVSPLNFHPGEAELDAVIDLPPYALPHLKLLAADYVTTSIGLVIRKAGG
ncbi:class I SAM-dependent methyltransferase [Belnapia sp. F-4-1]|uniref:class I SAM-dependent methyltransferase n=1 Tax=Belnapia sp. F-4-1 TaxID=1545443 RepID=UPI000689585E|nr:class I SAM-dependent methyltransferase [Belnapia sp. F-4-1]